MGHHDRVDDGIHDARDSEDTGQGEETGETTAEDVGLADTPHHRVTIDEMTVDQLEQTVIAIRARRDVVSERVARAAAIHRNAKEGVAAHKLGKLLKRAQTELAAVNARIAKLEDVVTRMRVSLIEMGEQP